MPRKGPLSESTTPVVQLAPFKHPPAPECFLPAEKVIWDSSISAMRDSWFTAATFPVLEAYCSTCVMAAELAKEMRGMPVTDPRWRGLMRQHRELVKSMCLAGTKLRLLPSSNKSTKDGRRQQHYPRPWETDDSA
jgi:hypothetical protein